MERHPLNFYRYKLTAATFEPSFSVDYFIENENSMRKFTLDALEKNRLSDNPQIIVITQLYRRDKQHGTYEEILASIQANLLNPFISEFHLLQENDYYNSDLMELINSKKIKVSILGSKMMVSDFMEYCNKNLKDRIVILTTADIYFDHTLVYANKVNFKSPMALSRRQTFTAEKAFCEKTQMSFLS